MPKIFAIFVAALLGLLSGSAAHAAEFDPIAELYTSETFESSELPTVSTETENSISVETPTATAETVVGSGGATETEAIGEDFGETFAQPLHAATQISSFSYAAYLPGTSARTGELSRTGPTGIALAAFFGSLSLASFRRKKSQI